MRLVPSALEKAYTAYLRETDDYKIAVQKAIVAYLKHVRRPGLTKRQHQVLHFILEHGQREGYAPTFQEIADHLQVSSLATVAEHVANLERKGYLRRSYNEARSITIFQDEPA